MKKINCIMLIDDNADDNFFHERVIRKFSYADIILVKQSALDALNYFKKDLLESEYPDLIFLDINMPAMNGWEFLEEFNQLTKVSQRNPIIIMLTTSDNPDDKAKANTYEIVSDFRTKPLTKDMLDSIIQKFF
jgi:CheY-like chemotaxis protein